jgi:hypothetical protein
LYPTLERQYIFNVKSMDYWTNLYKNEVQGHT